MPGDELIRSNYEYEGGLIEDKVEYELHELPSGKVAKIPKDYIRVKMVDGHLVKEKGSVVTRIYPGCSHVRLSPEKEDALVVQAGARGGYCQRCPDPKLFCPKCLGRQCRYCKEFHNICEVCGLTCCKEHLFIEQESDGETKRCRAICTTCRETVTVPRANKASPTYAASMPVNPAPKTYVLQPTTSPPPPRPPQPPAQRIDPPPVEPIYSDADKSRISAVFVVIFILAVLMNIGRCSSSGQDRIGGLKVPSSFGTDAAVGQAVFDHQSTTPTASVQGPQESSLKSTQVKNTSLDPRADEKAMWGRHTIIQRGSPPWRSTQRMPALSTWYQARPPRRSR